MSSPNKEQKEAIYAPVNNVIVSAGAGSGKTFVLKSRVKDKILNKVNVNELVILTFTNAAAAEMKDRIRKVITEEAQNDDSFKAQLDLVESAYITTFDSYAQSLVKKYNYLLGIDKHFTIIEDNIVKNELRKITTEILLEYYKNPTDEFKDLIDDICYKDDEEFINTILKMYESLVNIKDKEEFLNNYEATYLTNDKFNELVKEYNDLIFDILVGLLRSYSKLLNYIDDEKSLDKMEDRIARLESASHYDEVFAILSERKPTIKDNDDEIIMNLKARVKAVEDEIKALAKYSINDLREQFEYAKSNILFILSILKELDKRITEFKDSHNAYEFQDIALKATTLVKEHEDVREDIKNHIHEIMIDEYQDTNDVQEEFISYISNNNVYMVGDIKQSIYRFRHANPYIFKDKYDRYAKTDDGIKIDMNKNYRSREEVIKNINDLFSTIMFEDIGGANYEKDHKMTSELEHYVNKFQDMNYDMKVYNYEKDENLDFTKVEIEAFTIAKDILEKMNSKMFIVDGDGNKNPIQWSDFCILIDKSKNFEGVKKILEYHGIPSTIYKELSIKEDDEVFILKNLITLLICIKEDDLKANFRHSFMSILRSYIYRTDDDNIFDIFNNNSYKETDLYKKLYDISLSIDGLSNKEILIRLIEEFDMFNKLITVGDIEDRSSKLEYFINNADSLNKFGMDIYSLNEYFDNITKSDDDLKKGGNEASKNAVKIMTIHKSKGLEFPFVYLPYLYSSFKSKKETRYPLSSKYGIVLPYKKDNLLDDTFIKHIYDYNELKENVSEKIRLLYVAITRAREQFILINSWNDRIKPIDNIESLDVLRCKTYQDILSIMKDKLSKYVEEVDLKDLNLTTEYNLVSDDNYDSMIEDSNNTITTTPLEIDYKVLESKHFSKSLSKIIDKSFKELLDFGTMMHYCFEVYDFNNDNLNDLNISDEYKDNIRNFLKHDEVKDISNAITYKEHEIRFNKDGSTFHGFIDLLVEYDDHFDIIDYKLSNVDSEEYVNQLSGYKEYIEATYNKPCNMYLYSIKKDIFKKL